MIREDLPAMVVYVGTFSSTAPHGRGRAEGIYVYRLDPSSGALIGTHTKPGIANPAFLALDPGRRYLYAVNEVPEIDGHAGGAVSAFAIDPATGDLTYLNRQSSHGSDPCHLSVDRTGRFVLVANYGGGSVALLPIGDDGRLDPATDFHQHQGASVDPQRQRGPHAHSINLDPTNRYALAPDLGLDQVLIYRLDLEQGALRPNDPPSAPLPAGSGPRHLAFHPSAPYAYVINELGSTMTTLAWDGANGTLRPIQTVSTLPSDFAGRSHCADVHVAPSGRFVYGSNRGHDSIVIFAVDPATGTLTLVGHESTRGQTPRNFAIDPTGTFLLAANQGTDTIVTFRIDGETGRLAPTGPVTSVPTPVCVTIAPLDA